MRKVFNEVELWSPKKKVGVQNKNKYEIIRLVENRCIINPEKFIAAVITTFDPTDDSDEASKIMQRYLELHELEMFSLLMVGVTIKGLVKPKDIPLAEYLEL